MTRRRWTEADAREWLALYESGLTIEGVSLEVGVATVTVHSWLVKLGYTPRPAGAPGVPWKHGDIQPHGSSPAKAAAVVVSLASACTARTVRSELGVLTASQRPALLLVVTQSANNQEARMTRTDVHAPKNLITEDYEFVGCGNFGTATTPAYSPLAHGARYLIDEGWTFDENSSAGDCYHCGASLIYYAILKHLPTRKLIRVGETCLDNRFSLATAEFHQLRKAAQLDRERQRIKTRRAEWLDESPANAEAYEYAQTATGDDWCVRFVRAIESNGEASEKWTAAILRTKQRETERNARRAQQDAERAAEPSAPVVTGAVVEITGRLLSIKSHENDFGCRSVMTVLDDRGFRIWGTCPREISAAAYSQLDEQRAQRVAERRMRLDALQADGVKAAEAGDDERLAGLLDRAQAINAEPALTLAQFLQQTEIRVAFTGRDVTASDRDDTFGFFKRPTKGRIL